MLHHVYSFSHPLTPLTTYLSLYVQGLCPLAKRRLRRDETPAARSASARCEVDDGGMDEATRAAIACAYEGESGAWEGGEGGGAWAEAGG